MKINEPWRESIHSTLLTPGPVNYGEGVLPGLAAQLGIDSIRASVLDRYSLVVLNSWSLSTKSDVQTNTAEAGLDSAFIASRDVDYSLRDAKAEHTIIRKLSPRLWSFTWLANVDQLILVEARYPEPRDALDDQDAALIRLLFLNLALQDTLAFGQQESDLPENTSPSLNNQGSFGWLGLCQLILLCACALLASWVAFFGLQAASNDELARQAETVRLQTIADQTVIQHLSKALATGDYGDLQDELSGFHALGYYPRGLVLNASKRVVATAGEGNAANIGDAAPEINSANTRSVALTRGSEELGYFIYPQRKASTEKNSLSDIKMFAAASSLAALGAIVFFLLLLRRR